MRVFKSDEGVFWITALLESDGRPSKKCGFFGVSLTLGNHTVIKVVPQLSWWH